MNAKGWPLKCVLLLLPVVLNVNTNEQPPLSGQDLNENNKNKYCKQADNSSP